MAYFSAVGAFLMQNLSAWSAASFVWILHVARNEHRTEDANCGNDGLKSGSSESPGHSTCIDTKLRSWSVRTWIHVLLDFVGLFGLRNCTKSTAVLNLCLSQQGFFEGRNIPYWTILRLVTLKPLHQITNAAVNSANLCTLFTLASHGVPSFLKIWKIVSISLSPWNSAAPLSDVVLWHNGDFQT